MTAIALRPECDAREPRVPSTPRSSPRAASGQPSFRDELAEETSPIRGRTPIKRMTIPPVAAQPQPAGDPATAIAAVASTIVASATPTAIPTPIQVAQIETAPIEAAPIAQRAPSLTPLEQAVQTLLAQLSPEVDPDPIVETDEDQPELAGLADVPAPVTHAAPNAARVAPDSHRAHPVAPAPPAELARPETPSNPSHVHLVMEDGAERVVITVAVRGDEVRVAMRANDDSTVAALARNAGSLDHALRARGLDLTDFTAGDRDRSPAREDRHGRDPHDSPPERQDPRAPRFRLEETA